MSKNLKSGTGQARPSVAPKNNDQARASAAPRNNDQARASAAPRNNDQARASAAPKPADKPKPPAISKSGVQIWRLKGGSDKRFRAGHPWVYSNELAESPKGLEAGAPVELQDAGGKFLARGFGNPASLISFRTLSRKEIPMDPLSGESLLATLRSAGSLRDTLGLSAVSHRLCFGEADQLPGLIIDRYRMAGGGQTFVLQAHSAGMDRLVPRFVEVLEAYNRQRSQDPISWDQTAIVLRNDVGVRRLEGMEEQEPKVLKEVAGLSLNDAKILVAGPYGKAATEFTTDLLGGQKTGFFLDQVANVQLAMSRLGHLQPAEGSRKIRILDLCCYVGQWSTQFTRVFRDAGFEVEVTLADASAKALEFAKSNITAAGGHPVLMKVDVLKELTGLADRSFDLVISDPPALIKGRKDLPAGTHAYLQLNTQVFRLARIGGGVVTCSCSALLEEEDFVKTLSKAAYRNQRAVRWIGRGGPGPDHPALAEFPEGRYLKAWVGVVEN